MMYVNVKFYKPEYEGYGGQEYIYKTELPLQVMDRVFAPSRGEECRAIVTEVNAVCTFDGEIKEITRWYTE